VARRRDLERDARQQAAEIPLNRLQEAIEGLEAALSSATGDLRTWLLAALQTLQEREQLSKPTSRTRKLKNQ
jgi:hypothetical protein